MAVTGVRETLRGFDAVEAEIRARTRRVVADTVRQVQARARAACPVGKEPGPFPGHVRDQILTQVSTGEPFGAVFVERRGLGGRYGTDNVGAWLEHGTVKHPARPFLRPAAEAERHHFRAALEAATETATRGTR